jgi:hypothetical protein
LEFETLVVVVLATEACILVVTPGPSLPTLVVVAENRMAKKLKLIGEFLW